MIKTDWMNPIVVKELRQGLKSRAFTGSFLALQGLMLFSMIMYMLVGSNRNDTMFANGFFWFMLGILLVAIIPFRAFQAIHEEQKNNTLEMIFLTRMSSWNIAFGKWLALVVQLLLMVTAVLPYLVMRYFLGAINIADDVMILGMLVIVAMLLTAAGVGFSGWKSKLLRGLLVAGAFMSIYLIPVTLIGVSRGSTMRLFNDPVVWISTMIGAFLLMMFLLEYGASTIAPPAENHALRKRILALVILALFVSVIVIKQASELIYAGLFFIVPICVDALCEPLHFVPSLYRSSGRGGWFGRVLRRMFYPGWPSGFIFFTFVMMVISAILIFEGPAFPKVAIFLTALIGTLLFPLAVILMFRPNSGNFMPAYIIIQLVMFIVSIVLYSAHMSGISGLNFLSGLLPMSTLFVVFSRKAPTDLFLASSLFTAVSMLIILIKMTGPWRRISALEKIE